MMAWWLLVTHLMLRVKDFEQLRDFVSHQTVSKVDAQSVSLARLSQIVRNAGARFPGTCLTRSLAGALLLARFGYCSEIRIGVSTDQDFQAHAWLESDGTAITEPEVPAAGWRPLTCLKVGS